MYDLTSASLFGDGGSSTVINIVSESKMANPIHITKEVT
jgi:hypothetical protein